jgi:hypothetical protein
VTMGQLIYGAETAYEMDDWTLVHIEAAAGAKLRRRDSFYLNWVIPPAHGSGRVSLWLAPGIPLQFHFLGGTTRTLNPLWVRAMELTAVSDHGMTVLPEHEASTFLRRHPHTGALLDDNLPRH